MTDKYSLPVGWAWTRLGEVCLDPQYGWTSSATKVGTLHLLRTTDITSGGIDWNSVPFCKVEPPEKEKYLLKDGDIVISRAGSVGYSHLIKNPTEAVFASYLIRFRPLIDEHYLAYFLKSPSYWRSISEKSLGIAIPNVNAAKLKQISIPLPPLSEQRRIVAKIEEQFTKLDAGVETLKKVKAQLRRHRQAVLKNAFEGKRTAEWREIHKGEIEPAAVLLERIKKELKKKAAKKKRKQKDLHSVDISDLLGLPENWVWVRIDEICNIRGRIGWRGYKKSDLRDKGSYVIGAQHLTGKWKISLKNPVFISNEKYQESPEIMASTGNIIIAQRGSIGKLAIVDFDLGKATINPCVLLMKDIKIVNKFLLYLLASPNYQDILLRGNKSTTTPMITQEFLKKLLIPLPPLQEQHKIVEEIERRFSVSDEVVKVVEQSLKRAERLRQSILKNAFEGKLVPQDPSDEPAEKLLECIRAEKAKRGARRKVKRRIKRKSPRKKKA